MNFASYLRWLSLPLPLLTSTLTAAPAPLAADKQQWVSQVNAKDAVLFIATALITFVNTYQPTDWLTDLLQGILAL